jgi:hypothetical protein
MKEEKAAPSSNKIKKNRKSKLRKTIVFWLSIFIASHLSSLSNEVHFNSI